MIYTFLTLIKREVGTMQKKINTSNIKKIIKKKCKELFTGWNSFTKSEKKEIINDAFKEYINTKESYQQETYTYEELIGIENQSCYDKIIPLNEMEAFIEGVNYHNVFNLTNYQGKNYINCPELKLIDDLLDDKVLDALLSYEGYSPNMRDIKLNQLLRAELLKTIKYPEISYRKFCTNQYFGMHQKENKDFVNLSIIKNNIIHHTQLSKFRNKLDFHNLVNILVYVIFLFKQKGFLDDGLIHGIDSTDLSITDQALLGSIEIDGKKINIYNDLNADCGKRRNKKDKSTFFIGYRMHTLTAINPDNGHNYPLISLLAPANHHDSLFAHPLLILAKAIGLDVKLVTADEAYNDNNADIYNDTGVTLITPCKSKVKTPDFVDIKCKQVFCNKNCEFPMEYLGTTDDNHHEFKCNAKWGECPFAGSCPRYRFIPFDSGYFQRIIFFLEHAESAVDIRKNSERPFNLLKNREGLKETRAKSQHGILARCTFAQMATLLIEMAGTRKKKKHNANRKIEKKLPFPIAA